jgi:hypothetical protein
MEFRTVEAALWGAAPGRLSDERREALRLRIFSQLGAQEAAAARWLPPVRTRWIAIPAGAGIAATIIATVQYAERTADHGGGGAATLAQANGQLRVDGLVRDVLNPGQTAEALSHSWLSFGSTVRIGLEPGSTVRYESNGEYLELRLLAGSITAATTGQTVSLRGNGWSATVAAGSVGRIGIVRGSTVIEAMEGEVRVTIGAESYIVTPANSPLYIPGPHPADATTEGTEGAHAAVLTEQAPTPEAAPPEPASAAAQEGHQASDGAEPNPADGVQPPPSGDGSSAATPPAADQSPPASNAGGNGKGTPPASPGSANPGTGAGNGGGAANGNGAANSNAGGTGNGGANSNAGGSGNGGANGNAGGNGNGAANGNAGGNANGEANSNAGGNGNGAANGNAGGTGNGAANGKGKPK